MKRLFDALNWALGALMVGFAIWAWSHLPDQVPTHFSISGHPDAWSQKTLYSWFSLPVVGIGLVTFLGFFRTFIPSHPRWVNLPDGHCLAELPEACQRQVLEMLSGFLALVQTEILVIFGLIHWASFRSAMGMHSQAIMILVLFLAVLTSPFLVIVFFLRFQGAMDRGMQASRRADAGTTGLRGGS